MLKLRTNFVLDLAMAAICLIAAPLPAAVIDKTNNASALNLGSSWVGGATPTAADIAQWSATVTSTNSVVLGANTHWLGLKITNPGGNVTIGGANTLTLSTNGIDLSTATRDLVLNCPLALTTGQSWNIAGGHSLTNAANVSGAGITLSKDGAGTNFVSSGTFTLQKLAVNTGRFVILGGTLTASGGTGAYDSMVVATGSILEQTGGSISTPNYLTVGQSTAGGTPLADLKSGSFSSGLDFLIGYAANGMLNVSGTANVTVGNNLRLGQAASATVNLNGGTVTTDAITTGTGGSTPVSTLNFNGGKLRASSAPANPWWNALACVTAYVKSGGAVIDDNGQSIIINQPLLDGTGGGGLTKTGGGTLTLTATNTFTGPVTVASGTLTVNGRHAGTGPATVGSGATLSGSGFLAGPVTVQNNATLACGGGDLAMGALTLNPGSILNFSLSSTNTGTNVVLRVNGNLTLDGSLIVTDLGGLKAGSNYTAIYYSGNLTNNGLTLNPLSPWNLTVDTSATNYVRLQLVSKYPLAEITNGNFTVNSTSTNLAGVLHGYPALPLWYEVRDQTNRLWDYGATPAVSPWSITVRHLRGGTNTVTIFAKDPTGNLTSNNVLLTLALGTNPAVRPRPQPAEIWWGGSCHENLYDTNGNIIGTYSRMSQLLQTNGWDFVKRYADGFFLHGYVWVNAAARMTNWQQVGQSISAQLAPFNGKYWLEDGWQPTTNNMNFGHSSASSQASDADDLLGVGFALSEITEDFNPKWGDFSRWHPDWPTNNIRVLVTGNTNLANATYPYASGLWRDHANDFRAARPNVKFGWTWSPVWFRWLNGASLGTDSGVFTVNSNGTNYNFNWDFYDWMNDAATVGGQAGVPFAFTSDCPWEYYSQNPGNPGGWSPAQQLANRVKIRNYEAWLQNQNLRHTLICNSQTMNAADTNASDLNYEAHSLSVMSLHQQEGGRATRYSFESWYQGPYTVIPETTPGSYTHLALSAIRFLKGIADTNGALEPLSLTLLTTGSVTTVRLQNDGDTACLPAVQAFETGNPATFIQYSNAAGTNITAQILSAEGYAHTNLLQPGQNTIITIAVQGIAAAQSKTVTLEAFWNPQDPTGIVRDRLSVAVPVIYGATNACTWTNNLSGNWGAASNWSNGLPPAPGGSENGTVRFLGSGGYTASNNLASQFTLNILETSCASTNTVNGNSLRFAATTPSGVSPQLNQKGAGTFILANAITLDSNLTLGGTGSGTVTLSGSIGGGGGLIKTGSHTVALAASNSFTGDVLINGGTLQLGDGTNNGELSSVLISNNATLRFLVASNSVQVFNGTIQGIGSLQKQGSGTLVLVGSNSFSGTVNLGASGINGGGLRISNAFALGSTAGATIIGGGVSDARLEIMGDINVPEPLTLTQDTGPIVHLLNISGSNTLSGDLTLNGGGNTWTIQSDAGCLAFTGNLTNTAAGFTRPIQLQGNGDGVLAGFISDNSQNWLQIRKYGSGTWTISGAATLPQGIQIFEGTMLVSGVVGVGTNSGNITLTNGTLGGGGTLLGPVTIQANGVLAPGSGGIRTLTISNHLALQPGSTTIFKISKSGATNDFIRGLRKLTFGGILIVTNLAGGLATNDTFKLFDATNYASSFSSLVLPPLNSGLIWSNRLALNGSIMVVKAPSPLLAFSLTSSNTLWFNWTNAAAYFVLQSQTNSLGAGLSTNWLDYPGGSNPPVPILPDKNSGSVLFRLISR